MRTKKALLYIVLAALLALMVKYSGELLNFAALLASVLTPLVIGCVMAYILNLLVVKIEALSVFKDTSSPLYKFRRAIGILASFIIIAAVIFLLIKMIIQIFY